MPLDTGVRLGPYEIVSPIGAEAGGEVYKASDTEQNRTVAIKLLPPVLSNNSELRHRFEGEVKALSGLSHPHICAPYEIRREADTDFLVMEYVEGETLAKRLERGALPLDEALKIAIDITDALNRAHTEGLVHRSLRPSNVMLTPEGPKLLDFGMANWEPPKEQGPPPTTDVRAKVTLPDVPDDFVRYMARAGGRPRCGHAIRIRAEEIANTPTLTKE
jgi:serine/threonine protein kinase